MIVKLTNILGRFEEPTVKVIEYNHSQAYIDSMWTGCLTTRKALAEVYGTVPMYLTTSPIFPQVQSTPDLYFREEIRNLKLHHDENEAADMQDRDNEYLMRQGRLEKVHPLEMPDIDRW